MTGRRLCSIALIVALGGCSLEPPYSTPTPAIPSSWPIHDPALLASERTLSSLDYRQVFVDARLQRVIAQSLAYNQDVRLALANIAAARGLYRVQRSAVLPTVTAGAGATVTYSPSGVADPTLSLVNGQLVQNGKTVAAEYSADIGASAFEIDLFGRVRSLTNAALDTYFATESAARAAKLTLVGDVANAWYTLATDRSLLAIAADTVKSARKSEELTKLRLDGGVAPRTDLRQAQTIRATAESDYANLSATVEQDRNALNLLAGSTVAETDLPPSIEAVETTARAPSAGLDSTILLRRPDVLEAEYKLRSANAQIGAARAAFFPRISLTGLAGLASGSLTSLFTSKAFSAAITPNISLPIFGGTNRGNLDYARAQREGALATYQKTLQTAFRDVANALARRGTIEQQVAAQQELVNASADTAALSEARYRGGIDTFLASLDAQRSLYSARRSLASTRLLRAQSVVATYQALGGDPSLQ